MLGKSNLQIYSIVIAGAIATVCEDRLEPEVTIHILTAVAIGGLGEAIFDLECAELAERSVFGCYRN